MSNAVVEDYIERASFIIAVITTLTQGEAREIIEAIRDVTSSGWVDQSISIADLIRMLERKKEKPNEIQTE